jgi:Cdc6-like AAA superfamily ATPase
MNNISYIEPELFIANVQKEKKTVSVDVVLDNPKSYMIWGKAGSGKTSLLNHFLHKVEGVEGKNTRGVYIRLRDYISPVDFATRCISEIESTPKDKLLYLFCDGLDETTQSSLFLSELKRLREKYPSVYIVVTSRNLETQEPETSSVFTNLEIEPLSEDKIKAYLKKQFGKNFKKIEEGLNNSPNIKNSISNPLLLEIFSKVISEYDIPVQNTNPSALLDIFVMQSLSDFDASRKQSNEVQLSIDEKLRFLERIAVYLAIEKQHSISLGDLANKLFSSSDCHNAKFHTKYLISQLISLPLLVTSMDGISFSHIMVFEYFLARSMVRSTGKKAFSISIPAESIRTDLIFTHPKSSDDINNYISGRLKLIGAYDTGSDVLYAKTGSIDLSLAIVLAPGVFYCFMKFADSFFTELGKVCAQKTTSSKNSISVPPYVEEELPDWILENEELKQKFLVELSRKYAERTNIQTLIDADPKKRSRELAQIAVLIAFGNKDDGVNVSTNKRANKAVQRKIRG